MKDFMESGSFSRAKGGEISGSASIIYNGNINQPVETVLQTSHLFSPLSDEVNHDTAFLDRINLFLPGWEITKFSRKILLITLVSVLIIFSRDPQISTKDYLLRCIG